MDPPLLGACYAAPAIRPTLRQAMKGIVDYEFGFMSWLQLVNWTDPSPFIEASVLQLSNEAVNTPCTLRLPYHRGTFQVKWNLSNPQCLDIA